jgi:hypothetical protein
MNLLNYIHYMKKTILVFPDTNSMADFLLVYKVKGVETNTVHLTISGRLSEKLVTTALMEYGAEIMCSTVVVI